MVSETFSQERSLLHSHGHSVCHSRVSLLGVGVGELVQGGIVVSYHGGCMSSLLSPLCRAITPHFYLVTYLNSLYQGCPFVHLLPFVFNDNLYESFFQGP